jgi:bile acid:Na+ symporter, BASS family
LTELKEDAIDGEVLRTLLVRVFLVVTMLAMGLGLDVRSIMRTVARPGLVGRSVAANLLLVPALGWLLLRVIHLPMDVELGFLVAVASPGAPIAPKLVQVA